MTELMQALPPLWLSLRLAFLSTILLLLAGIPLAWWLSHSRNRLVGLIEALVALPLVLPPTVIGFYLLLMLGGGGPLAPLWELLGHAPAFHFSGLVIGSLIYSLPFVVQPLIAAFRSQAPQIIEMAATLGAGPMDRMLHVGLPLARAGLLRAAVLGFAHTLGEFGVVLMIGGNIPGETRVLSIAIFQHVELMDYGTAHLLSGMLLAFSLLVLLLVYGRSRREIRREAAL